MFKAAISRTAPPRMRAVSHQLLLVIFFMARVTFRLGFTPHYGP